MGFETCHCGRGTVCVCNEHQSAESPPPTTVRGWLETLPEPLRARAIESSACLDQFPRPAWQTLAQVLYAMYVHGNSYFWLGVRHYVCGVGEDQPFDGECRIGYNAAKAAFGTKVVPQTKANRLEGFTKAAFEVPPKTPENIGNFDVAYVSIDPKELAELRAKAAAWDTFTPKFQYLMNFFSDLEGLKP